MTSGLANAHLPIADDHAARRLPAGPVIVTGGAGFIGSNLVAALQLVDRDRHIVVIDDFRSSKSANLTEACERRGAGPFLGEVQPRSTADVRWRRLLEALSPAAVFHLAAITDTTVDDERRMIEDNVGRFRSLLVESARAGVPVVYASSAATYGTPAQAARREPFPESAAGSPNNVYGFSKWLMEREHARVSAQASAAREQLGRAAPVGGGHAVGLRYFNVFGPGEARKGKMASMAYQLATQMLAGRNPRLFEPGDQRRDQVHVDDVVECTIASALSDARPGVYNLGSGVATTFNDVARHVREGLGFGEDDRPIEYFDMPVRIRAFYQDFTQADMRATAAGLKWQPRWEPGDALRSYGAWLSRTAASAAPVSIDSAD